MLKLPQKHSKKWLYITVGLFLATFIALIFTANTLNIDIAAQNLAGFAILSIVITAIISIGGYLGATAYFYTSLIALIIAMGYMLYISINKTAEGWSDLVSITSFIVIVAIGVVSAIAIQGILSFVSKKQKK